MLSSVLLVICNVLIPHAIQEDIQQLHEGHQGVEKTRLLARDSVYWPRINEDIANMVKIELQSLL